MNREVNVELETVRECSLQMGWQDATQYILITVFFYCIIISRLNLAGMADSRFYLIRSRDTFQLFISF